MDCSFFPHSAVLSDSRFYHSFQSKKLILNLEVKEYLLFFQTEKNIAYSSYKTNTCHKKIN